MRARREFGKGEVNNSFDFRVVPVVTLLLRLNHQPLDRVGWQFTRRNDGMSRRKARGAKRKAESSESLSGFALAAFCFSDYGLRLYCPVFEAVAPPRSAT